jgi:hypothetical protein
MKTLCHCIKRHSSFVRARCQPTILTLVRPRPPRALHVLTFGGLAGISMHLIAQTYSMMGRRQEGLDLNKKAVEFLQRVLPPNHPTIGKNDVAHVLRKRLRYNVWRAARCMVMVP